MLHHYYDIKDENKLPLKATFVDPYDNESFLVEKEETLSNFINKIQKRREEKGLAKIEDGQMRVFVVSSLYESTDKKLHDIFFIKKKATANFAQVVSLAKTMATEMIHGHKEIPGALRRQRALKCLSCKLHKGGSGWSAVANRS